MGRHKIDDARAAGLLGVPVYTLKKWTTGTRAPNASAVRLLDVLATVETLAPNIFSAFLPEPSQPVAKRSVGRPSKTKTN